MNRWHKEEQIARHEWRKHLHIHVESNKNSSHDRIGLDPYDVDCDCDTQIGRFRKTDAFDCGNAQCDTCHSDKYPKRLKHKYEIRADISFKEQLRELYEPEDCYAED